MYASESEESKETYVCSQTGLRTMTQLYSCMGKHHTSSVKRDLSHRTRNVLLTLYRHEAYRYCASIETNHKGLTDAKRDMLVKRPTDDT